MAHTDNTGSTGRQSTGKIEELVQEAQRYPQFMEWKKSAVEIAKRSGNHINPAHPAWDTPMNDVLNQQRRDADHLKDLRWKLDQRLVREDILPADREKVMTGLADVVSKATQAVLAR